MYIHTLSISYVSRTYQRQLSYNYCGLQTTMSDYFGRFFVLDGLYRVHFMAHVDQICPRVNVCLCLSICQYDVVMYSYIVYGRQTYKQHVCWFGHTLEKHVELQTICSLLYNVIIIVYKETNSLHVYQVLIQINDL